jgi:hypothetical protein
VVASGASLYSKSQHYFMDSLSGTVSSITSTHGLVGLPTLDIDDVKFGSSLVPQGSATNDENIALDQASFLVGEVNLKSKI